MHTDTITVQAVKPYLKSEYQFTSPALDGGAYSHLVLTGDSTWGKSAHSVT